VKVKGRNLDLLQMRFSTREEEEEGEKKSQMIWPKVNANSE